ncbi:MAG: NAD(P)/FAD-dependent oxidoreductase [Proteobacteria bacterium]|nr:NAD(P)/FAD-dependent oxidoreductase [Pseudomonadota bacterium]
MTEKRPKFWNKAGGDADHSGPYDTIVIGSGIGGMTTAAMLAKLGHRVLVLEQHYVPGGFTHTFRRKKWTWDVGVHAVGEVAGKSMPGRILKKLTDGKLEWASLGDVYEEFYFPDDFRIDFAGNRKQFRENLIAAFPDEREAIDEFLGLCRQVGRSMSGHYLSRLAPKRLGPIADRLFASASSEWLGRKTADVLAGLTDNPRLRTILAAQWGYYGSVPSRSSFAMQALVVRHFFHGAYYPVGGSGRIAEELLRTVAEAGGWTRVYASVEEILIEKGRAVGVRLESGEELRARNIVSAAGIMATTKRLLPRSVTGDWVDSIQSLNPASAHVCLYMGFKGDIRAAGAGSANKWFWRTWSSEEDVWEIDTEGELPPAKVLYCSFPSLKDPEHDPGEEQIHTGEAVTFVPWSVFEPYAKLAWKKRGPEYEAMKKRLHDALLKQFFEEMPELEPLLAFSELGTPATTQHFVRPMRGSIYGIEPTPERFQNPWLRPRSPIKGLYFSGSEVSGVGVVGAMMGGVLGAAAVEPIKAIRYLRKL